MSFVKFSQFPAELQVEVWQYALLAESQDRLVLLHRTYHVIPQKHLSSPYLSTSRLSRSEALRFYTVALSVGEIPLVPPMLRERVREYSMSQDALGNRPFSSGRNFLHSRTRAKRRGTVYLNPTHDTFVIGLCFSMHYATAFASSPSSDSHPRVIAEGGKQSRPLGRLYGGSLPLTACREVRNLVLAQRGTSDLQERSSIDPVSSTRPGKAALTLVRSIYFRPRAEFVWQRSVFSACTDFRHLWVQVPREERCYGRVFGSDAKYKLSGPEACAWTLFHDLQENGGSRRRWDIRTWHVNEKHSLPYVADPQDAVNGGPVSVMYVTMAEFQGPYAMWINNG
ncbi:hypothetical protein PG993_011248 [Apiospora rasikravindrae]|uniref:2EXR domain-containing protein n=1 Tax=Apiospora rasikravindrae TaxID=990691 RepID=A0ABR1SDN6_9PEZI